MDAAEWLRARMVDRVDRDGPTVWREAMLAVPRQVFVPEVIWLGTSHGFLPLRRDDDPDAWLGVAYGNRPIVVQVDDGRPTNPFGRGATSTLLSPYDVRGSLAALDAEPGMRVCEIGTGTGYTAALLAHRLGAGSITTVEVDAALAEDARRRLRQAGCDGVTVVHGDGAQLDGADVDGTGPHHMFDRLMCSATVRNVPPSWLRAVRPGGLIVTSWGTPYHGEALLRLTVRDDGTADGHIVRPTHCEWLRAQRVDATLIVAEGEADLSRTSTTSVDIVDIGGDYHACVAIGLRVPDCASVFIPPDDQWFVDPTTGSWARLHTRARGAPHIVNQYGPRDLWDEIETAYQWWLDRGRPPADTWQVTVTLDGTHAELEPATV